MLDKYDRVKNFITENGETTTQLVCFCLSIEANNIIINNDKINVNSKYKILNECINLKNNFNNIFEKEITKTDIEKIYIYNLKNMLLSQIISINILNEFDYNLDFLEKLTECIVNLYLNGNLNKKVIYKFINEYQKKNNLKNYELYLELFK